MGEKSRDATEKFETKVNRISTINKRLQEAYPMVGQTGGEDMLWRSLTMNAQRDLNQLTQKRMQQIAFYLYDSNPMAKRVIEIVGDFCIGDGFTYTAEDDDVLEVIDKFWNDPDNTLNENIYDNVTELCIFGENIFPVWVNPANGAVKLGYIDPGTIIKIKKDKVNPRLNDKIIWKKPRGRKEIEIKIINADRNTRSKSHGLLIGEAFHFTINKPIAATRGRSDLLSLADWLDGYDQFLFARLERAFLLNTFFEDIECEGMSQKELVEFVKSLPIDRRPGSIRAHNEKVKFQIISPKLEGADASNEARLFKNQILGGAGYPEHWFAEGGKTTRACYSEDTETLTENGWKKYWEIKKGEKIATFNPKKDRIEFHLPKGFYLYDYKGEMYHFINTRTDILVTPEHRMWLKESYSQKWEIIQAQNIKYKDFYIREGVKNWIGKKQKYFDLPYVSYDIQSRQKDSPRKIKMIDWIDFLGWYLSEGYLNKTKNQFSVRIAQKDKENIIKIKKMLLSLGFSFSTSDNGQGCTVFSINNKSLWYYLKENVGCVSGEKRIPKEILQLDKPYLKILFKSMMDGDGHYDNRKGRNSFSYSTKSNQLKDDFQILCFLIGFSTRASIAKKDKFQWFVISGSNTIERNLKSKDFTNNRNNFYKSNIQKEQYDGKVYCFEVPNHLFVTRRNSLIAIQLNTAMEMGLPTLKKLRKRQKIIKFQYMRMINFVIDQAIIAGTLLFNVNRKFNLIPSPIVSKDNKGLAESFNGYVDGLIKAVSKEWIADKDAENSIKVLISQIGTETFLSTDEKKEEEKKRKEKEDVDDEEIINDDEDTGGETDET